MASPHPHLPTCGPAVLEVRAGEGGDDAAAFAAELTDVIAASLRRSATTYRVETNGRTRTVHVEGDASTVAQLAGTHRIQRIPANDPRGRRHTSTATVAVLDSSVRQATQLDDADVQLELFSGSGAGGQHRNRHPLCCRARHLPTGIEAVSTRHKSRRQNTADAVAELARRVVAHERAAERTSRNQARRAQIDPADNAKTWTWNTQRGQVIDHRSGASLRLRDLQRGKLPATGRRRA